MTETIVNNLTEELTSQMREWRHSIHQHPETAYEEIKTSALVAEVPNRAAQPEVLVACWNSLAVLRLAADVRAVAA